MGSSHESAACVSTGRNPAEAGEEGQQVSTRQNTIDTIGFAYGAGGVAAESRIE